jgi:hypothetical protein
MSTIIVVADSVKDRFKFLTHVRRLTGLAFSDLNARINANHPIAEFRLFFNDHEEIAARIRDLITIQSNDEGTLKIYELMDDEDFRACPRGECEISTEILENILNAHDEARRKRNS